MRRVQGTVEGAIARQAHRVTSLERLAGEWSPELRFAVLVRSDAEKDEVRKLCKSGLNNVQWITSAGLTHGDVITPSLSSSEFIVLHRDSDQHHSLQLTNRCNSNCLMCSQPPTKHEDGWMISEAIEVIRHIGASPQSIGLTGGEPLLDPNGLRNVIELIRALHPSTQVEVLTNGRLLASDFVANAVVTGTEVKLRWLVPLYGHADFLHDFVVQAPGAFEETVAGLLNLQQRKQAIQLRIALIEPVIEALPELCSFIGRNLPFVQEVALMGCEPIGFALANRDICHVDLKQHSPTIERAMRILMRYRIPGILMNVPLCAIPSTLWDASARSISDWKNSYAPQCEPCIVRDRCSGLFKWYESGWAPTTLKPILEILE